MKKLVHAHTDGQMTTHNTVSQKLTFYFMTGELKHPVAKNVTVYIIWFHTKIWFSLQATYCGHAELPEKWNKWINGLIKDIEHRHKENPYYQYNKNFVTECDLCPQLQKWNRIKDTVC